MLHRTICIIALSVTTLFTGAALAGNGCETADLPGLQEPDIVGEFKLCANPQGVTLQANLEGLQAGHAYTLWLFYWDDPAACGEACDIPHLFLDDPLAVVTRMDSGIAPRNGKLVLRGSVGAMQPSEGSLWWVAVNGHGEADFEDGRRLARQLMTPEDPELGAPHLGNHVDGPSFTIAAFGAAPTP